MGGGGWGLARQALFTESKILTHFRDTRFFYKKVSHAPSTRLS